MNLEKRESASRRALKIIKLLKGRAFSGLSNQEIALAIKDSPANVTRACQLLIEEGLVEKNASGRFVLGMGMLQIAVAHQKEMSGVIDRVHEINQRVNAGAY